MGMSDREKFVELYLSAEKGCLCTFKAEDATNTLLPVFKLPETGRSRDILLLGLGILKHILHTTGICQPTTGCNVMGLCPTLQKVQTIIAGPATTVVVDLIKHTHPLIAFSASKVLVALFQFSQFQEKEMNHFIWNDDGTCVAFSLTAMEKILFLKENMNRKSLNPLKEARKECDDQSYVILKDNSNRVYSSVLLNPEVLNLLSQETFQISLSKKEDSADSTAQTVLLCECLKLYQTSLTCFYGSSTKLMDCFAIRSSSLLKRSASLPFPLSKLVVDIYYYILTLDYSTYLLQRSRSFQPSEQCVLIASGLLQVIEEDGSFLESTLLDSVTVGFGGLSTVSGDGYQTLNLILLKKHFLLTLLSCYFYLYKNQTESPKEKSVETVARCLQTCLDTVQSHHESLHSDFCDCLFTLFGEEDDLMILALSSSLDLYGLVKEISDSNSESVKKKLCTLCSPHKLFIMFLSSLACHDHSLLLDLLLSTETFFLHYLVQYLKLVQDDWSYFYNEHIHFAQDSFDKNGQGSPLDRTMSTLIRLRLAIEKAKNKGLFPYVIDPLLKLLLNVEKLYEKT